MIKFSAKSTLLIIWPRKSSIKVLAGDGRDLCHGDERRGDLFATGVLDVNGDADVFARNKRSSIELQRARHETTLTRTPTRQRLGVHPNALLKNARTHTCSVWVRTLVSLPERQQNQTGCRLISFCMLICLGLLC